MFTILALWALLPLAPEAGAAARPEMVLLETLAKPFAPVESASAECARDSALYLADLQRYSPWALRMYDASAKLGPGVITGHYEQLGNYDECVAIATDYGFLGQACSATVQFDVSPDDGGPRDLDVGDLLLNVAVASNASKWSSGSTVNYEWMWCVPSTCSYSEIQGALEAALYPLKVEGRVGMVVRVPEESCHTVETDRAKLDASDWVYISVLVGFAAVVISSTVYDVARGKHMSTLQRKGKKHSVLASFSFCANAKSLLRTDRHRDSIGCLDGLRFISICWIIYGHTHYTEAVGVKIDATRVAHMHHDASTMLVLNGNIVTDTFFLISGILLAYTEMLKREKNSRWRFDVVGLYVHRYLRLTPAYAMMIGLYATLFSKFGSGPHWNRWVGLNRDYCRENWWTNLLYVNNYVNIASMCMSQSWYLATDMQLIWLSPVFLYPMLKLKRSRFFWSILAVGFAVSVLLPFLVTFGLRLTGTMLYYRDTTVVAEVYSHIYTRVYNRAGPYIVGLGLGYLLCTTRTYRIRIPPLYAVCGWLTAIVAGLSAVFGPVGMYYEEHAYSRLEASFYAGLHRHAFALSVAWIVFTCVHGYAGILGHFLSWRGWAPLSRLSYSAYLCHYVFILSRSGSVRTAGTLAPMDVVYTYFGNLIMTMMLSAIWTLSFEMPFMILDRTLLSRGDWCFGLFSKSDEAKIFGSIDSEKQFYRSADASAGLSETYEQNERSAPSSVYNSVVDVGFPCEKSEGAEGSRTKTEKDRRTPCRVYVIENDDAAGK